MASELDNSTEALASIPAPPGLIERAHELVRTHPHITFAELSRMNRRQGELNKASRHPLTGP